MTDKPSVRLNLSVIAGDTKVYQFMSVTLAEGESTNARLPLPPGLEQWPHIIVHVEAIDVPKEDDSELLAIVNAAREMIRYDTPPLHRASLHDKIFVRVEHYRALVEALAAYFDDEDWSNL